jgi:CDP-diacylglycerol--inositol 3-phosphatidyltransferase
MVGQRWPVWLFVPNVIGYVRIILSTIALYHWQRPVQFSKYYSVAFILDAADGLAARVFKQSSEFGALLDMLTDRCATAALLVIISGIAPRIAPFAMSAAFLDGYSHFLQFAAGLCTQSKSHKTASPGWLLELYYWRPMLTFVCTLNEFCFLAMYMIVSGSPGKVLLPWILPRWRLADIVCCISAPVCIFKQAISVHQVFAASNTIREAVSFKEGSVKDARLR